MSSQFEAPGLTADWLNGWLAAIGVTVLVPGVRLSWSDEAVPFAVFHMKEVLDLPAAVGEVLVSEANLARSAIARVDDAGTEFPRNVSLTAYRRRAEVERRSHSWSLAASVTDLRADADLDDLDHGPFDPPAPRGETLWSRALACARMVPVDERADQVRQSLGGVAARVQVNGLGFDPRRLPSSVQASGAASKVYADPVVELLCFSALALFPTRGDGKSVRQRGWTDRPTQRGAFRWVAWLPALDRWGIDAFLDLDPPPVDQVVARFGSVPYRPSAVADTTRAYFAERLP
jgi:hypothetical protein